MKNLSTLLLFAGFFSGGISFAQKADSTQTKKDSAQKANYFSKYKKPQSSTTPQVNESWNKKQGEKKVESSYQTTENGRVTGGKTTLKLGKKN